MTLQQIKTKVEYSKEYSFLKENPKLGDNIIILGLGGSHAYGMATPNSDLDIRGVALPSKQDLLLQKDFEQIVEEKTDTTIYSLKKIVKLLTENNPNTLEIIGLEPWQYLKLTEQGKLLVNSRNLFLSQRVIKTFGGYADQQLHRLKQLDANNYDVDALERHVMNVINRVHASFPEQYASYGEGDISLYIDKSDLPDRETEIFMDVTLKHYPLRDYCDQWNVLQNIIRSYNKVGKRNEYALRKGKMAKHMSHLIRLNLMLIDLLRFGELKVYRDKDIPLLMEIRGGRYLTSDNRVLSEFYDLVEDLNDKISQASAKTELPPTPNFEEIERLTMNINSTIF